MKYARCNNAGENEILKGHAHRKGWVFSLSTPCQVLCNKAEQKFATLFNGLHAMLNIGKFSSLLKNGFLAEIASSQEN